MWLIIIIAVIIIVMILFYWFYPRLYKKLDKAYNNHEVSKNTIFYNFFSLILTIFAMCTTYLAFNVQTEFNKFQVKQVEIEKAEKMVFEFINQRNIQVNNTTISDQTYGNRAFHFMFYEFKSLREVLVNLVKEEQQWQHLKDRDSFEKDMTIISYVCFYYGISRGTNKSAEYAVSEAFDGYYDALLIRFIEKIVYLQDLNNARAFYTEDHLKKDYANIIVRNKAILMEQTGDAMNEYFISDQKFMLFNGHLPTLDSYMRMLRMILSHFDTMKIGDDLKSYYLDILRSQFSAHELLIICLYSHFDSNFDWYKSGYLSTKNGNQLNILQDINKVVIGQVLPDWEEYINADQVQLEVLRGKE